MNQDKVETKPMATQDNLKANENMLSQLLAQVAKQAEENANLKIALEAERTAAAKNERQFVLKVSEKGGVTFNDQGMRRFGLTLYKQEWETLFKRVDTIKQFIDQHAKELSTISKKT